ncbi:uncharacterized protein LOC103710634 [Phoenix dactylifera]|uniref:Uncharacterized protein LOC103710634 n=1 Tax=Phoenix dactylifera TaxID=42345 RepID=A0A8B7C9T7_PHODC|nr:uncharacterized protein LOC103710634 [Phoenix dactylifera]
MGSREMETEEKRRTQPSGHEGAVCYKCGWVYPNPHPSAKQRRAHRKHCGTTAGATVSTAGSGAGGGGGKTASDEELSDEDRRKNSVELVVEDSKVAIEEGKGVKCCVESEGEVGNLGKDAILEINNADNTLEPYVLLHGSQVNGPGIQCSASQLESDKHFDNIALSCNADVSYSVNVDVATKHTESSVSSVLTKASVVASEKRQDFASAQSKINNTVIVNGDINGDIPVSPTLLGNHASDFSILDSQLQKMDGCVEINALLDHARVSTLMNIFPDEVSASIKEPNSDPCHAQDEQTDGGGQLSQNQLLSKAGSCLMENNDGECLDASAHSDRTEYQNGKPDKWKVNGNELENINALQMPSNTPLGEIFKMEPGFCDDYGSVEPNITVISAGAEAGNELNFHLEGEASEINVRRLGTGPCTDATLAQYRYGTVQNFFGVSSVNKPSVPGTEPVWRTMPEIVPVVELDKVANGIPSTIQVHESNPPYKDTVYINAVNELNDEQSREDEHVNGDRSTLVDDFEREAGLSLAISEGFEGLRSDGLETHSCITITGTSGVQEIILDDQVTGSHGTCVASIRLEGFETEFQSEEHSYSSTELLLCDNMVAAEVSGVATSDFSQANVTTKISNEIQLVIDEETKVSNHFSAGELKQEICEEESCHSTKTYPQLKYDTVESEPLPYEYIGVNQLEKGKDLSASTLLDHVLGLEHNENNSRNLENRTEDHSDQLEHEKFLPINFTEYIIGDDTDVPDMRMKLQNDHTNTANSLSEELHDELDDVKVQTERMENLSGSQLGPQNGFQDDSMVTSVGDDNNCSIPETGVQVPCIQTENGLAKLSGEEPDSKESSVHLCIHSAQDFTLEGHVTSSTSVESSFKNTITCNDLEMDGITGVASGVCYQSLQEEHVRGEPKQQPNVSADTNGQTDSVEEIQGSVSDGIVPPIRHRTDGISILEPQILSPAKTQTPEDLCTSNVEEGSLPESCDIDSVIFKEPSFMTQVEPGRLSVSHEIQSIQNSQGESEAGKKNEEITAKAARWNSGKVHVPLKTLLAKANFENQQVANAREHDKPLEEDKSRASQDERCTAKAWSSKIASERPTESSLSRADYSEWNSPARLPVNKNQKRRAKGKQPWVSFSCCPSIY